MTCHIIILFKFHFSFLFFTANVWERVRVYFRVALRVGLVVTICYGLNICIDEEKKDALARRLVVNVFSIVYLDKLAKRIAATADLLLVNFIQAVQEKFAFTSSAERIDDKSKDD